LHNQDKQANIINSQSKQIRLY